MAANYDGLNSAEKLTQILVGLQRIKKDSPTMIVGDALISITGEGSVAEAVWHVMTISQQVKSCMERSDTVADIRPYVRWHKDISQVCSPPYVHNQVGQVEVFFSNDSATRDSLAICADQLKTLEAKQSDADFLNDLDEALGELFASVEMASELDAPSRRTLLRLIQCVRTAIAQYRIFGSEGLRSAAEAMFGGFVIQSPNLTKMAEVSPESRSRIKRVMSTIGKLFEKVKPAAESANAALEVWEKISQLQGPQI